MKNLIAPLRIPFVAVGLAAACSGAFATDYARVVSSTPVTTQVSVPRQQCSDAPGYVQPTTSGGGAVVGGVLGGLAGNAIGAGAGRAVATGIGAVAGALVGNQVEAANTPPIPVTTTNCVYVRTLESRITGYDVVYEYNGQQRMTRMAHDPGARIAMNVTPVSDAPVESLPMTTTTVVQDPGYPAGYPAYPAYPAYPVYPVPAYDPYPYGYGYVGFPVIYGGGRVTGGWGRGDGWGGGGWGGHGGGPRGR